MTERLYRSVADELTRLIKSGDFVAGQRLPTERELADRFQVSRPTVREAVIALEIAGMVSVRKGSGAYVNELQETDSLAAIDLDVGAFELTEARLIIEGEAAAMAAANITSEELEQLETTLQNMIEENADQESGSVAGEYADKDFHMIIARATRNSAIETIVEYLWSLREKSTLTRNMYETVRLMGIRPSIKEHEDILAALKAGDVTAARDAMRTHLGRVIETMFEATEIEAVEQAKKKVSADRARHNYALSLQTKLS